MIRVEKVSKKFPVRRSDMVEEFDPEQEELDEPDDLEEPEAEASVETAAAAPDEAGDVWALRDIDLTIRSGEKVGFIGGSGSGKSTLLSIIAGNTLPTSGMVRGSGELISLGAIRSPISGRATGRENLLLLCEFLDIPKRRLLDRIEEIAAFADIGPLLDRRTEIYSGGTYPRLAFAAALALEPQILIVDEVFMVGDTAFRRKLLERLEEMTGGNTTMLVATHQMETIERLCRRVIWLDQARIRADGVPGQVIPRYLQGQPDEQAPPLPATLDQDEAALLNDYGETDAFADAPLPLGAFHLHERDPNRAGQAAAASTSVTPAVRRIVVREWADKDKSWQKRGRKLLEKRQRQRRQRASRVAIGETAVGAEPSELGMLRRIRLLDDQGRETGEVAPGEDLFVEVTFEAFTAGIHVDATLDLWTDDVLVAKSRLPTLFTVPHEGHYFFSIQIDGALFEQIVERQSYEANLWLAFNHAEAVPPGFPFGPKPGPEDEPAMAQDVVSGAVHFEVRGDIDQRIKRLEYSAGPLRMPLLRPRFDWSVERNVLRRDKR